MTMTAGTRLGTSTLTIARVGAVLVSLGTFVFLFVSGGFRADNLFLVPDLILCVGLVIAAILPGASAAPALIFTLGLAAGVLTSSVSASAVNGQFSVPSLFAAASATALALLLIWKNRLRRSGPRPQQLA